MTNIQTVRTVRAVIGAALVTLAAACSDAPAGPWQARQDAEADRAVERVKDDFVRTETPFIAGGNEMLTRREVRGRDGQRYVIESIRDASGLPREVRVSRNGQSVARMSNAWRRAGAGYVLEHQRMTQYTSGRASAVVDSRSGGGVYALAGGPIVAHARVAAASRADAAGVRSATRLRSLEYDGSTDGGGCDAEARAVESAIDDWLYSVVVLAGATVTANPIATWSAYAYQLKKYRDLTRTEATLDECVAKAGKAVDEM
ncbi:MAG: hypothetical protein Q8K55_16610 [Gemmatimonadaceae bacterium]|nr:hypothetical protein [Gemmatimonadaceae bacterium]